MDDTAKLARRLAGALGRKIDVHHLDVVHGESVVFTDGSCAALMSTGNLGYFSSADGTEQGWWRNGRKLSDAEADQL